MSILNPDDPNQNQPGGDQPTTPAGGETQPVGGQPPSQPAAPGEKCVTCGNASSGGNCVACGQGQVSCTCPPAQGGAGPAPGAPAV